MIKKITLCSPEIPPPLLCPALEPSFVAHENPWFKVMSRGTYYTIEYDRPQVVVLPILNGNSVIMVRVKRPLIDDCPLELPAGDSIDNETPLLAAMREFKEETGIRIDATDRFAPLLPVSEMPGRIPVLLSIFEVNVNQREFLSRSAHDPDIASVEVISFSDLVLKIVDGEIYLSSPMAIIARYLLKNYLNNPSMDKIC